MVYAAPVTGNTNSQKWLSMLGADRAAISRNSLAALSLVAGIFAAAPAAAQEAAPEIGTAVAIKRIVTAKLGDDKRKLSEGARVHRTEYLETGPESHAELRLDDQTKLALGPNAGLTLDDFVIGQSNGVTTIGVNMVKGTFRFLTGSQDSKSYRIETPSATIGVRGTVFDVYVDGKGDTLVLLHEGEVNVCSRKQNCQRHNAVGRIVHANVGGIVSAPLKFTSKLIPGLTSVGRAFPFVGRSLKIDPVRRLKAADLIDPIANPVGAVQKSFGRALRLPF